MFESFLFLRPWWLLAALPALILAVLWARRRMSASHWESSIDPVLLAVLLDPVGNSGFRRLAWAVAFALALAAVGLAGPAWERLPQPVEQKNDALVIVFDLSLSMFARDVKPSRLVRARQKIADVLRARAEGYTALIAYAGDAHTVAPLTDDTRTIENLLASLGPEMMPVLGSNLENALTLAQSLFENARIPQGRLLLVTDAIDDPGSVRVLCDRRFPLSILGVGTPAGGTIPLDFVNQAGQVLRTQANDPIVARLDEDRLTSLATNCHGRYRTLELGDTDINDLLATPLPSEDETREVEREFDTWADMGYLAALVLLPLLLLGFRRGLFAALCLCILPPPAHAGLWDDLWQRPDQQAYRSLNEGDPDLAAALFTDPKWRAIARYRSSDFGGAAEGFAGFEDPESAYNRGNALAQAGDLEAAIAAYDQTLAAEPDHEDARFNRELVQRMLEEQQSSAENSEGEGEDGGNPQDQNQPQYGEEGQQPQDDQQQGDQPEEPPEPEASEQDQSQSDDQAEPGETDEGESSRDERQEALEAWLRRVPDDPGGLLRRKFQYETNQRLRSGDYSGRETEKIW